MSSLVPSFERQQGAAPRQALIATLGAEPQVVTLALDALMARAVPVERVIVVHTLLLFLPHILQRTV